MVEFIEDAAAGLDPIGLAFQLVRLDQGFGPISCSISQSRPDRRDRRLGGHRLHTVPTWHVGPNASRFPEDHDTSGIPTGSVANANSLPRSMVVTLGYGRIANTLANLGNHVSDQTI